MKEGVSRIYFRFILFLSNLIQNYFNFRNLTPETASESLARTLSLDFLEFPQTMDQIQLIIVQIFLPQIIF